jgi:hypothetical protein
VSVFQYFVDNFFRIPFFFCQCFVPKLVKIPRIFIIVVWKVFNARRYPFSSSNSPAVLNAVVAEQNNSTATTGNFFCVVIGVHVADFEVEVGSEWCVIDFKLINDASFDPML